MSRIKFYQIIQKNFFDFSIRKILLPFILFSNILFSQNIYAACGGTVVTWTAGNNNQSWGNNTNWDISSPDTTGEDALIVSSAKPTKINTSDTIGCLEVLSGELRSRTAATTLTITGDYFKAHTSATLDITAGHDLTFVMAGSGDQSIEIVDPINNLEISNDNTVTIPNSYGFEVRTGFTLSGTSTVLKINGDLFLSDFNTPITIPAGVTVEVGQGGTFTAEGGLIVNGTLKVQAGSALVIGYGNTLQVNSGGVFQMNGASGSTATLNASSSGTYTFNMAGNMTANYFSISRTDASGVNVTGTISSMGDGEFHNIASTGSAMTWGASAVIPSTLTTMGFFDDDSYANNNNIDASAFNVSDVTIEDWSGLDGTTNEVDTNNRITWGSQAGTALTLTLNNNVAKPVEPGNSVTAGAVADEFAIFSFNLNQVSTSTDITSIKFTLDGTGSSSDIDYIQVFNQGAGCQIQGAQIGSNLTMSGSPATATISIPTATVSTDGTSAACIHVYVKTTASAQNGVTVGIKIDGTTDVVNDQSYDWSGGSAPPVSAPTAPIAGDPTRIWKGTNSSNWVVNQNWNNGAFPITGVNCSIGGSASNTLLLTEDNICQNMTFPTGGDMDWGSTSFKLQIEGALEIQSGYTFTNATNGILEMIGTSTQSIAMATAFPNDFVVNNSGGASSIISVTGNSTINGNLTITSGTLKVLNGNTLTVLGNIIVQTGAVLQVDDGGVLALGNGSTLTVDSGAKLMLVGVSGTDAQVTSDQASSAYNVIVNGTIEARYYVFDHLGTAGVSIEAGATIDASNHLQNGSFSYPVNNSSTFLFLKQQIPTNTLNDMSFGIGGSAATGTVNINTTGASAGTLTLDNYSGDLTGAIFDTDPAYLLSWLGATNTVLLTQEFAGPSPLDAGVTYNMGRFGFQQESAGASFVNTDITSLKLSLTGTGSSNDVDEMRIYYDSNCDGVSGSLVGTGVFSGSPATKTFSIGAASATVESDLTTPPKRCIYVEFDVALAAVDGNTIGVQIAVSNDLVNDQAYAVSSSTPAPVTLGTPGTIAGATETSWSGGTSTDWGTASNWTAGLPDQDVSCTINTGASNPTIAAGTTGTCKNITIGNGTLTLGSAASILDIYGSYENTSTGTFNQASGTLRLSEVGSGSSQTIGSVSTIESMTFNKTLTGGTVGVSGTTLAITTLTIPGGSDFTFNIANGKTVILGSSFTLSAGLFKIDNAGTLKMPNASTFTVNSGGILRMLGTSGSHAVMTSDAGGSAFDVNINTGELQAQYYTFDHLGVNGVTIGSGATINTSYHLQDGSFTYPVNNSSTLLSLARQVPTNSMDNVNFDLDGSVATGTVNINTTGATAGTLTINNFTGDVSGLVFDTDPTYNISWTGALNTIKVTQEAIGPTSVNAGSTYNMGRFGFQQALAGASFSDTDISTFKVKLLGTNAASDVDWMRVYYDADCDSAGGTLVDAGTLSGSPATATFTLTAGEATIPADITAPAKRCIYIEFDVASGAVNANSIGVEISADSYFSNSQTYAIDASTPTPIGLGTAANIVGASSTTWTGATDTDWFTAGNWSSGLPTSAKNCVIEDVANDPVIGSSGAVCDSLTNNGVITMTNAAGATLEVNSDLSNTGSITQNDGVITITDLGAATNNTISSTAVLSSLTFNKVSGGEVLMNTGTMQVDTLTIPVSSNFTFKVATNVTLKVSNSFTVNGATLWIDQGSTLSIANNKTVTIASDATLKMLGTSVNYATMGSTGATDAFNVIVNGTILAQYYTFDHLNTTGVSIEATATIDGTYHLQDGSFTYPVNNTTTLLTLKKVVPTNTMDNCYFDLVDSSATGTVNIDTSAIGTAGPLTLDSYTGSLAGPALDNPGTYDIAWTGALNTIDISAEASTPISMNAGSTYNVGRFGFVQTLAGASYTNADITSLKLTLTGTADASDIDAVRIYYDSACSGSAGTLIGTNTYSGSPETITFTPGAGDATVESDVTTPPMRCIYVEYDIAIGAINNHTAGVRLADAGHFITDLGYTTISPPVDLGSAGTIVGTTATTWTGTTSTDWSVASNWSAGVPTSTATCTIVDAANDPIIGSGVIADCNNLISTNGIITLADATSSLDIHGNYSNSGSFTGNGGTLKIHDIVGVTQNFDSSSTIDVLEFDKIGGVFNFSSSVTITTLILTGTDSYIINVPSGTTLTLPNGLTLGQETFNISGGATVEIGNTKSISITGGTFNIIGTEDQFPQNLSNKGKVTVQTSGTWGFNAISGTVNLGGFQFDYIDTNGLRINGSTSLAKMKGGQFTNLSNTYASVTAIQFNSSGSFPITADWVGFNWKPNNITPANTELYTILSTSGNGCNSGAIDFTGWFGDWVDDTPTFDVDTKISATGCTVGFGSQAAASAVSLTALSATPYNGAVDIKWETSIEKDHLGFNVYRSNADGGGYVQINDSLVRNINTATSYRGKYRFIDNDVINGKSYFYYIEDIEIDNTTAEVHGPISATPLATLSAVPADGVDENSGVNSNQGDDAVTDPATIGNNSFKDLGDGVVILSQTNSSLRLQITPGAPVFTIATWDGSYETVAIRGYTSSLEVGSPELLERTLLIEVYGASETATASNPTVLESTVPGHLISPAPAYAESSGALVPAWSPNTSVYSTNADSATSFYNLQGTIESVGSKKYLKIKLNPLIYNPVTRDTRAASKITLDISLDGNNWNISNPVDNLTYTPGIIGNTLRIEYNKTGLYELTYDDLYDSSVEGPFDSQAVSDFRIYHKGAEIPLEMTSAGANFQSGDKFRFYVPYEKSFEDNKNFVILSTVDVLDSNSTPLDMGTLDGDPSLGSVSSETGAYYHFEYEENNFSVLNDPVGVGRDLFYWSRMVAPAPWANADYSDVTVPMPTFKDNSFKNVEIKLHVKGSPLSANTVSTPHYGEEIKHNIAVFINDSMVALDDVIFEGNTPQVITISMSNRFSQFSSSYNSGNNKIRVKNMGTYVPSGGAYDLIYLDKVEVNYWGELAAVNGAINIEQPELNSVATAVNFPSNNISVYDTSNPRNTKIMTNTSIATNAVEFFVNEDNGDYGLSYTIVEDANVLKPFSLTLSAGYSPLKDSMRSADLLVIGEQSLINSAYKLIDQRESQGLIVASVTLDQIYNEFSHGLVSSQAIRDFITYSQTQWSTPTPRYVLFLGDTTYDPLDSEGYGADAARGALTVPMPMVSGRFINFGSDNWFASGNSSNHLPSISLGRLPSNNPVTLSEYVDKMLNYENGSIAPSTGLKHLSFISDKDTSNEEGFRGLVDQLSSIGGVKSQFSTSVLDSADYASNGDVNTALKDKFNEESFILTFMGHGATNLWSEIGVFSGTDAGNLTNSTLPVVMAFNCENAYFYDPDKNTRSLGESFVFNQSAGAVAFLGSTTLVTPAAQMKIATAFYNELGSVAAQTYSHTTLGDLMLRAKVSVGSSAYTKDMIESFVLIGDPSMPLPEKIFKPEVVVTESQSKSSGGSGVLGGLGCSANASDGGETSQPWYVGIINILFLFFIGYLINRSGTFINRIFFSDSKK
jgi:hypothetical protein